MQIQQRRRLSLKSIAPYLISAFITGAILQGAFAIQRSFAADAIREHQQTELLRQILKEQNTD